MSFINNDKTIENQVNDLRIKLELRILWPDFQIYDLLGEDLPFQQIQQLASFPPLIIKLDIENINQNELISRQFTHIAIAKKFQISSNLKVTQVVYAFLTKRNIAIDQINCRYMRGKHYLAVQVAQLNRQFSLWGAEVVTNSVQIVSPKYIIKRNSIWHLEFQFDNNIKNIIFYSTKRQPNYQKNHSSVQLPKDATKESCLKYRCYSSVLDSYFKKNQDQIIVEEFRGVPLFMSNHTQGFRSSQVLEKEEEVLSNCFEKKCKIIHSCEQSESNISSDIKNKIKIKIEEEPIFLYIQEKQERLISLKKKIDQIKVLINQLDLISEELFKEFVQNQQNSLFWLEYFKHIKQVTLDQKLQVLQRVKIFQNGTLSDYIYGISISNIINIEISRKNWLKLFKHGQTVLNHQLKQLSLEVMKYLLILQSPHILKDSDDELEQFEELIGPSIFNLIVQALCQHQNNVAVISDILFILMKLQKCENIFQLYDKNQLIDQRVIITESIGSKLQKLLLPLNKNLNIMYQANLNILTYECISINKNSTQTINLGQFFSDSKRYEISLKQSYKTFCFVSQTIQIEKGRFIVYLIRDQQFLSCFIECISIEKSINSGSRLQSYNVLIQTKIKEILYDYSFGWNFCSSSNAVGWKLQQNSQQFEEIDLTIYMKKEVVHQSIINYLIIRHAELMKFPKSIVASQIKKNKQNERLSKRRSTFQLQHSLISKETQSIQMQCFLHTKCEKCLHLLQSKNLYQIKPVDMHCLLTTSDFMQEKNVVFVLFKYFSIHSQYIDQIRWLMYTLRINYIAVKDLLDLYSHLQMRQQIYIILKYLIEYKLKLDIVSSREIKGNRKTIDAFFLKGRRLEEIRKFIEKQYGRQFLEYIKKQNLKQSLKQSNKS